MTDYGRKHGLDPIRILKAAFTALRPREPIIEGLFGSPGKVPRPLDGGEGFRVRGYVPQPHPQPLSFPGRRGGRKRNSKRRWFGFVEWQTANLEQVMHGRSRFAQAGVRIVWWRTVAARRHILITHFAIGFPDDETANDVFSTNDKMAEAVRIIAEEAAAIVRHLERLVGNAPLEGETENARQIFARPLKERDHLVRKIRGGLVRHAMSLVPAVRCRISFCPV